MTSGRGKWRGIAAAILLIASAGWFTLRGPMNRNLRLFDFADGYEASRAWVLGRSPFDEKELAKAWISNGGSQAIGEMIAVTPTVLPPTTSVVIAPMTLLPPGAAG